MYISASAPDAPPFNDTTTGAFIRLFFWIAACIIRAIWSEAPPAPAATTISTGLVGSHAAKAGALANSAASATVVFRKFRMCSSLVGFKQVLPHFAVNPLAIQANRRDSAYDFRMGSIAGLTPRS